MNKINLFCIEEDYWYQWLFIDYFINYQWDNSVRILDIIPAKESSEKPIIIKEDSYFFKYTFEFEADDRLLRVSATNCINFSWFFICWRMPMIIWSSVSFFSNSSLDCELISVTKANISNTCSFTSTGISVFIRTRSNALMFWVTAGARV